MTMKSLKVWWSVNVVLRVSESAWGPLLTPRARREDDRVDLLLRTAVGPNPHWWDQATDVTAYPSEALVELCGHLSLLEPHPGEQWWLRWWRALECRWSLRWQFSLPVRLVSRRRQYSYLEHERFMRATPGLVDEGLAHLRASVAERGSGGGPGRGTVADG